MLFYLVGRKGRAPLIRRAWPKAVLHYVRHQRSARSRLWPRPRKYRCRAGRAITTEGKFDIAHLFYLDLQESALTQEPTEQQIIPVPAPAGSPTDNSRGAVEYEPDEDEILAELLPRYLKTQLFGALLENHGFRARRLDDRDGQRHAQRGRADQTR